MNYEWMKLTKDYISSIGKWFDLFEEKNAIELSSLKASDIYIWDMTNFIMYLIASDRSINIEEVEVYRYLTGYGGDNMDSIKQNIEEGDVMSYDFQSKIPTSLRLLVNATNRVMQHGWDISIDDILKGYISTFIFAGREIMRADDCVSYQERRDYELYIKNMISYIEERSYAIFEQPLVNLLED